MSARWLVLVLALAGICAAFACDQTVSVPAITVSITGYVQADGEDFDAGVPRDGGIYASARSLTFYAIVSAPPGSWQLTATAEGAFALANGAATATRTFQSLGQDAGPPLTTAIPLAIQDPVGVGVVHISVGDESADFSFEVTPEGIKIDGVVEADGQDFDAGIIPLAPGISAAVHSLMFYAKIQAPPGTWVASVSTSGALALASAASNTNQTFESYVGAVTTLGFPLQITDPVGTGVVHVTVANTAADFTFAIAPITATISACLLGDDGGCADAASVPVVDAGCGGESFALAASTSLQVGQAVLLLVDPTPLPAVPGATWMGTIATTGAISVASADAAFQITSSSPTIAVPAQLTSAGVGVITVSIGGVPCGTQTLDVGSAVVALRDVAFVTHVSVLAMDRLRVCTTAASGSLTASIVEDAGSLVAPTVALTTPAPSDCPTGLPGEATFDWVGSQPLVGLTLSLNGASPLPTIFARTYGTDVSVAARVTSSTWSDGPDGGGVNVAATLYVERNAFSATCGADAGWEALPNTALSLVLPPGFDAGAGATATDVNGVATVSLTAPPKTTSFSALLNAGGVVSTPFLFEEDAGAQDGGS